MQANSSTLWSELGRILRVLRLQARKDQASLAQSLGLSQSTVSRLEYGGTRPQLTELSGWLNNCAVSQDRAAILLQAWEDLQAGQEAAAARGLRSLRETLLRQAAEHLETSVPLFAEVAAGLGEDQAPRYGPREQVAVPAELLRRDPGAYALRVRGDSMAPLLADGDIVVVSPRAPLSEACIVAAQIEPDGDVVKQYHRLSDGRIELRPLNPTYPCICLCAGSETAARLRDSGRAVPADLLEQGGEQGQLWGRVVLLLRDL
jgi:SOS-response transcriptional repressor LexA